MMLNLTEDGVFMNTKRRVRSRNDVCQDRLLRMPLKITHAWVCILFINRFFSQTNRAKGNSYST